jgi:glycosyltransferase involved in cell wall biosynthesis
MRVAFYAPLKPPSHPSPSGDRRMARLLMAALRLAGHRVELASTFRSYDRAGDPDNQERLKARGLNTAKRLIATYRGLSVADRPKAWFTYHLYHKAPDWLGPAVAEALSIPYLVAEASHAPKRARGPWDSGYRAAAAAIARADVVFNINSNDAVCLRPLLKKDARAVALKPFLDGDVFRAARMSAADHRAEIRTRYGLDETTPRLLAVAMMRPGDKLASYSILGEALSRLRDRPWRLLVAGDGAARAEVEATLQPISDRVTWLGQVDGETLPRLYAASDLYVWPSVNEAYGMALLEAASSGLAIVAARTGGVADIVIDGVTGMLAKPADGASFAEGVARLLDDPARRQAMGQAAAEAAQRDHDLASASRLLDAVLAEVPS